MVNCLQNSWDKPVTVEFNYYMKIQQAEHQFKKGISELLYSEFLWPRLLLLFTYIYAMECNNPQKTFLYSF